MAEGVRGNVKNPAIRRIHADIRELQKDPSDQYAAAPLEENLFEWHFTLRGPPGTDFAGGVYHGRILLPAEYPFKPPNIMLLTPNGRFEVGKKICLSISAHHPEHWQPAWGVRLILEALISFFPTEPKGAVGSLDWTPKEHRRLARESTSWCCARCGPAAALLPPEVPSTTTSDAANADAAAGTETATAAGAGAGAGPRNRYAEEIAQLYVRGGSGGSDPPAAVVDDDASSSSTPMGRGGAPGGGVGAPPPPEEQHQQVEAAAPAVPVPSEAMAEHELRQRPAAAAAATAAAAAAVAVTDPPTTQRRQHAPRGEGEEEEKEDRLLYIALGLLLLIALLLGRKVMRAAAGAGAGDEDGMAAYFEGAADEDYFVG